MKEGAPAGKRSVANPCLPSAKEGGIEGREGILGGSPALSMERIAALCSREIHPPVRAGQSLPGPGGEMLRWARKDMKIRRIPRRQKKIDIILQIF